MLRRSPPSPRRGAILPYAVVALVMLIGFVALAIDLGMMAVARTQCQNAADAAAMAGARTLDGNATTNNNLTNAVATARSTAQGNRVLGKAIQVAQVSADAGSYVYDDSTTTPKFVGRVPSNQGEPYTLMRVRIDGVSTPTAFARVFGVGSFNTSAVATGVHRPRDIAVVVDFSGSMRFSSLLGVPYSGTRDAGLGGRASGSNNPEAIFPKFGHYSDEAAAGLKSTSDRTIWGYKYEQSNVTSSEPGNDNRPTIVSAFYQNAAFATVKTPAFANPYGGSVYPQLPPDSYATTPGGDNYMRKQNSASQPYASTMSEVLTGNSADNPPKDTQWETKGYEQFTASVFNGYTYGPRYWGKTFFIWPPDPRSQSDWRRRFFFKNDQTSPLDDNSFLWDSSGNWLVPQSGTTVNYYINYKAILDWLKNTGPNPFPSRVRAGNIVYYSALPERVTVEHAGRELLVAFRFPLRVLRGGCLRNSP